MRVAILSTGLTEWHGLHLAIERQFPGHTFSQIPTHAEVDSDPDHFPYDGFPSNRISGDAVDDPPERASGWRAAQEALGDPDREAADLVVILDDLELPNVAQPLLVADVMRAAAQHVSGLSGRFQARTAQALRERVSFHLAAPMIEACLFADPGAIRRLIPISPAQPRPSR